MPATLALQNSAAETNGVTDLGLRERKKARLRQQIIDTSIRLFRKRGYESTRIDDIVQALEISQPTFFRYFPSKDAVLREVGERGYACICERLRSELSSKAQTSERLRRLYTTMAREVEADRQLWQAVVLSGAMDPVRSAEYPSLSAEYHLELSSICSIIKLLGISILVIINYADREVKALFF